MWKKNQKQRMIGYLLCVMNWVYTHGIWAMICELWCLMNVFKKKISNFFNVAKISIFDWIFLNGTSFQFHQTMMKILLKILSFLFNQIKWKKSKISLKMARKNLSKQMTFLMICSINKISTKNAKWLHTKSWMGEINMAKQWVLSEF